MFRLFEINALDSIANISVPTDLYCIFVLFHFFFSDRMGFKSTENNSNEYHKKDELAESIRMEMRNVSMRKNIFSEILTSKIFDFIRRRETMLFFLGHCSTFSFDEPIV